MAEVSLGTVWTGTPNSASNHDLLEIANFFNASKNQGRAKKAKNAWGSKNLKFDI